jgi:hypothetical protein
MFDCVHSCAKANAQHTEIFSWFTERTFIVHTLRFFLNPVHSSEIDIFGMGLLPLLNSSSRNRRNLLNIKGISYSSLQMLSEPFPIPTNIYKISARHAFRIECRSAIAVVFVNLGYNENLNYAKFFSIKFCCSENQLKSFQHFNL